MGRGRGRISNNSSIKHIDGAMWWVYGAGYIEYCLQGAFHHTCQASLSLQCLLQSLHWYLRMRLQLLCYSPSRHKQGLRYHLSALTPSSQPSPSRYSVPYVRS